MYKVAHVIRFRPDVTQAEGVDRWNGHHADLMSQVPRILAYVQNYAAAALHLVGRDPDRRPAFDGYSCLWFADREAYAHAIETPQWDAVCADAASLFDESHWPRMSAALDERLIVDGPQGELKVMWFGRFPPDVRSDPVRTRASSDYWTAVHGRRHGVTVPGIGRYLQNHVVEQLYGDEDPGFDGFSEMWFENDAAYERMNASLEWAEMNEDAATLFDRDWIVTGWSAALTEHVVLH